MIFRRKGVAFHYRVVWLSVWLRLLESHNGEQHCACSDSSSTVPVPTKTKHQVPDKFCTKCRYFYSFSFWKLKLDLCNSNLFWYKLSWLDMQEVKSSLTGIIYSWWLFNLLFGDDTLKASKNRENFEMFAPFNVLIKMFMSW